MQSSDSGRHLLALSCPLIKTPRIEPPDANKRLSVCIGYGPSRAIRNREGCLWAGAEAGRRIGGSHMKLKQHISDTAFLVCESRIRRLDVSQDPYAERWIPAERRDAVRELWEDFSGEVYPYDDLELAIRNRFFLERLQRFVTANRGAVFFNVGAGFTSYPLLLKDYVGSVELDFPHMVRFKQRRFRELCAAGAAPRRRVRFVAADIAGPEGQNTLRRCLANVPPGTPTFILLEGISYYLNFTVLRSLFELFREYQPAGSQVAFDFWRPDLVHHPVFLRLQKFFSERFGYRAQDYCLFGDDRIDGVSGYRALQLTDVAKEEPNYAGTQLLAGNPNMLLENYALLERL